MNYIKPIKCFTILFITALLAFSANSLNAAKCTVYLSELKNAKKITFDIDDKSVTITGGKEWHYKNTVGEVRKAIAKKLGIDRFSFLLYCDKGESMGNTWSSYQFAEVLFDNYEYVEITTELHARNTFTIFIIRRKNGGEEIDFSEVDEISEGNAWNKIVAKELKEAVLTHFNKHKTFAELPAPKKDDSKDDKKDEKKDENKKEENKDDKTLKSSDSTKS